MTDPATARAWSWLTFYAWKVWNRTRYYWPQAQARKRAITNLRRHAPPGWNYTVTVPWWWPIGGTGTFVEIDRSPVVERVSAYTGTHT